MHDIEKALNKARYVVNAVPSQYVRSVFKDMAQYLGDEATIISVSKGIERGTLLTVSSVLEELLSREVAVLSGPSFAREVIRKLPTAVTVATKDKKTGYILQELFNFNNFFRVYTHDDIIGVEIGGALKNVIGNSYGYFRFFRSGEQCESLSYNKRAC